MSEVSLAELLKTSVECECTSPSGTVYPDGYIKLKGYDHPRPYVLYLDNLSSTYCVSVLIFVNEIFLKSLVIQPGSSATGIPITHDRSSNTVVAVLNMTEDKGERSPAIFANLES